ncbi:FFLEELY motif protein [Pseudomarimonas salicorniae]|uniref:DUF8198 domain-containing protein n=1 Tax=Pseudomarimonas salicorniae TaxID=2933270 RepID=A0ABT0GL01_9GAMM|nr:hypothetical protein [Lysobacter sp. CAU 1642]MCK7594899.1 hypothetical protein [Lysobacter sp. CAU 1642]
MRRSPVQARLPQLLEANRRLHDPDLEPRNRLPLLGPLRRWQAERLRESFTDFLASPRERPAAEFFLSDLYGDFDVSGRDRDVERVLPVMRRVLPDKLLGAAADAIELAALSHALDLRLAATLHTLIERPPITVEAYAEAYRKMGLRRLRRHQVMLIHQVGIDLDRAVSKPAIGTLLRLSRGPARAAGLAELQTFLERGFSAFRALGGASGFVEEIARRELEVSRRLFEGHPEPFAVTPRG